MNYLCSGFQFTCKVSWKIPKKQINIPIKFDPMKTTDTQTQLLIQLVGIVAERVNAYLLAAVTLTAGLLLAAAL